MGFFARLFSVFAAKRDRPSLPPAVEEDLLKSKQGLETMLDQLPSVVLYETGGGREYISSNVEKLLGYSAAELMGPPGNFSALIHPNDRESLGKELAEWAEQGRPGIFTSQFRARNRAGKYLWLEDRITSTQYENGQQGMVGVMINITNRHAAQQRYQAIVEAADVAGIGLGIFVSRDGIPTILYMNEAAQKIGGRSREEMIGEPIMQFLPKDARPTIEALWQRFLRGDLVRHSFELDLLHTDGSRVPSAIGISATLLEDEPALIAFITNITEQKKAEETLVRAKMEAEEISRIKSNILSNFSHELRTPLHSILGFSSLLADETQEEELREYAYSIQRSGQRLLSTVTAIIEIAALESSSGELVLYPTLVSELLEAETLPLKSAAEERGTELILNMPNQDLLVLLDKNRFHKAFEKIASNALKFTKGGSIYVELKESHRILHGRREDLALICIRDTGIGMSPEFVETAFEKFMQESTGFSRTYEGTGLGLPLARSYIKLMNGEIELKSEPGVGTEVIVSFPIAGRLK